jgi:hypothetical protein
MVWQLAAAAAVGSLVKGAGDKKAAERSAKGYEQAQREMQELKLEAPKAAGIADPFQQYRGTYATQLHEILQGKRDFRTDPGYGFAYNEAMRAGTRQAAASGYGHSGNLMAGLQGRASGLASQQYGQIIDRLIGLAGATPTAPQTAGQIYGNIMTTAHTGVAQGNIGEGHARGQGISSLYSGIGNAITGAAGAYTPAGGGLPEITGGGNLAGGYSVAPSGDLVNLNRGFG